MLKLLEIIYTMVSFMIIFNGIASDASEGGFFCCILNALKPY